MFFALSKTLDLLFSPLFWTFALGALCALAARRGRVRPARALGVAAALMLYVPATGWCARALFGYLERFEGRTMRQSVRYDAVILLGGFIRRGEERATELAESADRLIGAWELLASGRAQRVVIAGGAPAAWGREADVAAELLERLGVDRSRMLLDSNSRNTRENALQVRAIAERAKLKRMVLVTSAYHMQRALECMHAVGLDPDAYATDYQRPELVSAFDWVLPRSASLALSERGLRELAGRAIYRARGYAR